MMHIVYFFRKPTAAFHSVEVLFDTIISCLSSASAGKVYMPYKSASPLKLLLNCFYAHNRQAQVNHITGDVNYLALALVRKRTVLTIHDIESLKSNSRIKEAILKFFWLYLPVKRAKYVTVVSEHSKKQLLTATNVAEDKVIVIPNSIRLIKGQYKPKATINKQCPVLLQVGTKPNKNLENLIKAIEELPCKLIIIGALTVAQKILLKESHIDYENHVAVTYEKVMDLYYQADMVTFVSVYEGFGLPILEANALGRPVITSTTTAMPEVAGEAALLVNPQEPSQLKEAILKLIADDQLREELVQAGYRNVQRFRSDVIAAQYEALYKQVIEES